MINHVDRQAHLTNGFTGPRYTTQGLEKGPIEQGSHLYKISQAAGNVGIPPEQPRCERIVCENASFIHASTGYGLLKLDGSISQPESRK